MKKLAIVLLVALAAVGFATAEPADATQISCSPENFKIENLAQLPAWVTDGGFKVEEVNPEDHNLTTCPITLCQPFKICLNPTGVCEGANCATSDTGLTSCSLGAYTFQCPSGQTIQQRSCQVCECPDGSVCSNSGSSSIYCG